MLYDIRYTHLVEVLVQLQDGLGDDGLLVAQLALGHLALVEEQPPHVVAVGADLQRP